MIGDYTQKRPLSANYLNFTRGMAQSPLAAVREMRMVDAGISFNLPYPPISGLRPERKADIIIFVDASGGVISNELKLTEQFARAQHLKFPSIDYNGIDKHAITVFRSEQDLQAPVVIYVPRIVDEALLNTQKDNPALSSYISLLKGFNIEHCIAQEDCNTFNFVYSEKQARSLIALGAFNVSGEL